MGATDERTREPADPGAGELVEAGGPSLEQLGRYELCAELATGGMATVYLARSKGPDGFVRVCAVKRIHPHLAKRSAFLDMLLDEARIAARIDHPNVCQVFDFGKSPEGPFLAMEYLAGETLSRVMARIASGAAPEWLARSPAFASAIVAEACEGLHAAHELADADGRPAHVVHRDVSPQNLFVTFAGGVKVVDFGIASATGKIHETATDEVKGKAAYMAPEQIESAKVDRRADVWALGVVLWELLTIKRLFRRDSASATMRAVEREPIDPPSRWRPEIPAALDAIVLRALERDPARRYSSADELGRDLRAFVRTEGPVLRSDLAEWMLALFPEGPARERALRARAEAGTTPVRVPRERQQATHSTQITKSVGSRGWDGARVLWITAAILAVLAAIGVVSIVASPAPARMASPRVEAPPPDVGRPRGRIERAVPQVQAHAPVVERETHDVPPAPEPIEVVAPPRAEVPPPPARRPRAIADRAGERPARRERATSPQAEDATEGEVARDVQAPLAEQAPAEPGCLRVASEIALELDGTAWLEGPLRCASVAAGVHRVAVYELDRRTLIAVRSIDVRPGESVAITRP